MDRYVPMRDCGCDVVTGATRMQESTLCEVVSCRVQGLLLCTLV